MSYKLFLDDLRSVDMVYRNWTDDDFVIVRSFDAFKAVILEKGLPVYISFDNDLGLDEQERVAPDGYAAAKWLVHESGFDLSGLEFYVHSANPVAAKQIQGLLENYIRHLKEQTMTTREHIIQQYISAYNTMDVDAMLLYMAPSIRFENVSNGETTMVLEGIDAFRQQAGQAKALFSSRRQTITEWRHEGNQTEVTIDYHAVLAIDLPNGLKKGDTLDLKGRSVFIVEGEQIIGLKDIA